MPNASAYQSDESTPSPTLEPPATLLPEKTQPAITNTAGEAALTESVETATNTPAFTDTVVPENSATPTAKDSPPLPILSGQYEPDQVLIRFKNIATNEGIQKCLSSSGATVLSSIEGLRVWVAQVEFGNVAESIAVISICPEVRYVEPNYMAFITDIIPSDPNWGLQYGLVNIRAPQGWDFSTGSSAVTIAIIDSGVDLNHADLVAKIVPGYDFVNNDAIAQDDNGHGTHVAGIAAASANNGVGIAGVSWGARIMPVKVLNSSGNGSFADVAAGIIWAADNGAQVINLSLGGASPSTVLQDAVNYAYGKGVVLVAAAGNTGGNFVLYPAHYPNVIAVAATDGTNTRAGFSNYGLEVDFSAPGVSIYSTQFGSYGYRSGTSMAAPFVSGLAAILRGIPGNGSPAVITAQIESTVLDLGLTGWDDFYGYGLIQMDAAIQLALPPTATPTLTMTPAPGLGYSTPFQPVNPFSSASFTPSITATWTPTILPDQTATFSTFTPSTSASDETPEVSALDATLTSRIVRPPLTSRLGNDWPLGCWGILLILAGILLFWAATRKKRRKHPKISH